MGAATNPIRFRSLLLFLAVLLCCNEICSVEANRRVVPSKRPWWGTDVIARSTAGDNLCSVANCHNAEANNEFQRFLSDTKSRFSNNEQNAQYAFFRLRKRRLLPSVTCTSDVLLHRVQNAAKKKMKESEVRPLTFFETMVCGAVSRSIAQTTMHPANTMKTLLQRGTATGLLTVSGFPRLFRGAGANFLLSIPHGAINFAVLELIRSKLSASLDWGAGVDFASSCIATVTCSIVSTPQMMICDNIMAGNYPNLFQATAGLAKQRGIAGFYTGWWPGLVGKIPSYALTWTFFQQLKRIRNRIVPDREATDLENSAMGSMASALSVCLMIPVDTIKTRLVTQGSDRVYSGIIDCAVKTFQNEGMKAFYRGLPPRLVSVVPMIGIQFGVYEFMKKVMLKRQVQAIQEEERRQQQKMIEGDLAVEGTD